MSIAGGQQGRNPIKQAADHRHEIFGRRARRYQLGSDRLTTLTHSPLRTTTGDVSSMKGGWFHGRNRHCVGTCFYEPIALRTTPGTGNVTLNAVVGTLGTSTKTSPPPGGNIDIDAVQDIRS